MPQEDDPVRRLAEQAALARAQAQQKRLKQQRLDAQINPHCVSLGFDADSGLEIVRAVDGSILLGGPITSGARGVGDTLLLHQGEGRATVDAPPAVRRRPVTRKKFVPPVEVYPFKILFSVVEDGVQKFYVGGDRVTPELIYSLDLSTGATLEKAWLTNTGPKKDDWIAGIKIKTEQIITA